MTQLADLHRCAVRAEDPHVPVAQHFLKESIGADAAVSRIIHYLEEQIGSC